MTFSPEPEGKKYTAVVALQCTCPSVRDDKESECVQFRRGGSWVGRVYCSFAICLTRFSDSAYFLCGNAVVQGIAPTKE
jgi:hypothetical protein